MSDSADFSLAMPFVVVASVGGPYEDVAYTAGFEAGIVYAMLRPRTNERYEQTMRTDNLRQIHHVAMQHGYVMTHEPHPDVPEWSTVVFERARGVRVDGTLYVDGG